MAKGKKARKLQRTQDRWRSLPKDVLNNVAYGSQTYRAGIQRGQNFAMATIIAGVVLSLLGISGNIEWVVKTTNFMTRLQNAGPGVFLALLGAGLLAYYKPRNSQETTFDRERRSAPSLTVGGSWHSIGSVSQTGCRVTTERVTHRHEERGAGGVPENRSMQGRYERKG